MFAFDTATIDLRMRQGLFAGVLLFSFLKMLSEAFWINACFLILMSGFVGYYTNYLAIKMLFHPKRGSVLGWSGLVPKNKARIAQSLAHSIQHKLLAPEIVIDYIQRHHIIERTAAQSVAWAEQKIKDETVRKAITYKVTSLLKQSGPTLVERAFLMGEQTFKTIAQDPQEIDRLWFQVRAQVAKYIYEEENRRQVAEMIRRAIWQDLPALSRMLNEELENYLQKRGQVIGRMGKGLKQIVALDEAAIEKILQRFIEDPETSEQLMVIMDRLVEQFQERLNSAEAQVWITRKVEAWVNFTSQWARQTILPRGIDKLEAFLDVETNWAMLDAYFLKGVEWLRETALDYINSREGQESIRFLLDQLLPQVNLTLVIEERIMALETDDLEKLILDNTGGNLDMIQVIGGVLGLIAGLVQVNLWFTIPLLGLVGLGGFSHLVNEYQIKREDELQERLRNPSH